MSLDPFQRYLQIVETVLATKSRLPKDIDAIELESILVSHGVVLLYARMEQCFQAALEAKCNRCSDIEVRHFALSVKDQKTGKLKMEAVKETCHRFGIDHKARLSAELERLSISLSWDSIVNARQRVAHHAEAAACTLADLRKYYEDIRKVLGCICRTLSLSEDECTDICKLIEYHST